MTKGSDGFEKGQTWKRPNSTYKSVRNNTTKQGAHQYRTGSQTTMRISSGSTEAPGSLNPLLMLVKCKEAGQFPLRYSFTFSGKSKWGKKNLSWTTVLMYPLLFPNTLCCISISTIQAITIIRGQLQTAERISLGTDCLPDQPHSVRVLTYLAKKDFCSCGFFPFFSYSCSIRSRNRAVSGLEEKSAISIQTNPKTESASEREKKCWETCSIVWETMWSGQTKTTESNIQREKAALVYTRGFH